MKNATVLSKKKSRKTQKGEQAGSTTSDSARVRFQHKFTYDPVRASSRKLTLVWIGSKSFVESATNAGGVLSFRLNSAYDVDTALGSTTTPGFAEIQNYYTNYRVWRTTVRIEGVVTGGSAGALAQVVLFPNANVNAVPSSYITHGVQPQAKRMAVNVYNAGGRNFVVLQHTYDLPLLAGITKAQYIDEADYSAAVTTNPARQMYCFVSLLGNAATAPCGFVFIIYAEMEVEFFNPVTLSI